MSPVKIYLIQHGHALSKENNPLKPLSSQGIKDVTQLASACKAYGITAEKIFYSTKLRARQTAEIIGKELGIPTEERVGIEPLDPVGPLANELGQSETDLMIVGHLPFLERLVSHLLTGKEASHPLKFQQGGMACLSENEEGEWSILWTAFPDQPRL